MEAPALTAARLLRALEELVAQEGMYLRGGYYDIAAETRQRAEPLVQQLVALADLPGVRELAPQVAGLQERSAQHAAFLQEKLVALGAEIRRADQARYQTAQLAPAYAHAADAVPRFQAAG